MADYCRFASSIIMAELIKMLKTAFSVQDEKENWSVRGIASVNLAAVTNF